MSRHNPDYDDADYIQLSQRCEICCDRWLDDRPLKQWSKHPKVTVHVECDPEKPKKKRKLPKSIIKKHVSSKPFVRNLSS